MSKDANKVFELAGSALIEAALGVARRAFLPTVFFSNTSFWSGTRIQRVRMGNVSIDKVPIAAEQLVRENFSKYQTWAYAFVGMHPAKVKDGIAFIVKAGGKGTPHTLQVTQDFDPPAPGPYKFRGDPRFHFDSFSSGPLPIVGQDLAAILLSVQTGMRPWLRSSENQQLWAALKGAGLDIQN